MASSVKKWLRGLFKVISLIVFLAMMGGVAAAGLVFYSLVQGLPDVTTLKDFHHEHATEVFSDDRRKIGEFTTERRYPVRFESIPNHVLRAFIAAEDAKFYEHKGVDYNGIMRAVMSNLMKGRFAQGGSTITQQVARGLLLATRKKEITRKIREIVLAWRMERQLSKNEILSLYLSEIYLGHGAYGIGAAAKNYFNKKVEELTLAEAALLAGLPQRPNDWDPFRNPYAAKKRQQYVLKRMVDEEVVSEVEAKRALAEPIKLFDLEDINNKAAPYFTEYVRLYLMNKYGSDTVLSQGYKVDTTVRYDFQKAAERALDRGLRAVDKRLGWRGTVATLETAEKVEVFLAAVHETILDQLIRTRILPPAVDQNTRKLAYDMSLFEEKNSPYSGATPVKEGEYYKAVITEVFDGKALAVARVGKTTVHLPLEGIEWVRVDGQPVKLMSRLLKPRDVIQVKVEKIDRKTNTVSVSLEQEPEIQGALLCYETQTGFVRAMVGGRDFVESKFNRALHAKRQVGSTFKPLIYAAAIDKGFSPASIVTDSPIVFKFEGGLDADSQGEDWRPKNYTGKFEGDIPIRLALIRSMNIPTVKILNEIGVDYGIKYARTLGITSALPRDLSIGLGSWSSSLEELMRAYAIFPRLGKPVVLNYIKRVIDDKDKVVEELPAEVAESAKGFAVGETLDIQASGLVISPQTAYVMTDMLRAVVREGTGRHAAGVPGAIAGKTGTSNDHRDAWFIGYNPHVVAGIWIGFDKEKPLEQDETGGKAAAPIWADFMQEVVKHYPQTEFPVPDDIVFAYIDRMTGKLLTARTPSRVRVAFKVDTVPNLEGDNLPRIGEPSIRATTMESQEGQSLKPVLPPTIKEEETSEFLREGYQE